MADIDSVVNRAISDFDNIRDSIRDCGVDVPKGTDTSEYGRLVGEVYEKGVADSFEAGKQAEWNAFWDVYQQNGNRDGWNYAFYGNGWTDETYKPKHPISPKSSFGYMFAYSKITDTLVPLTFSLQSNSQVFRDSAIKNIPSITVAHGQTFVNWFVGCKALENINFVDCEIEKNIDFKDCKLLTVESMKSVIEHLKNYKGTSSDQTYSVTFSDECWTRLEETTPPEGYETWKDYVSDLGWAV